MKLIVAADTDVVVGCHMVRLAFRAGAEGGVSSLLPIANWLLHVFAQ